MEFKPLKVYTAPQAGAGVTAEVLNCAAFYDYRYKITSGTTTYGANDSYSLRFDNSGGHGSYIEIEFDCDITLNSAATSMVRLTGDLAFAIKGDGSGDLPAIYASKKFTFVAKNNAGTWVYQVYPSVDEDGIITANMLAADAIATASIADEAVTVGKMADLTRGSIITGQTASNRPTALAVGTANQFLRTDGTDVAWASLSGDATLSAGALTIAANAVTNAKLAGMTRGTVKYGNAAGAAADLTVGTASQFLGSDGTDITWRTMSGDATLSAGAITIGAGVIEQTMLDSEAAVEIIPLLVSFEAAGGTVPSVGDFKIKMPYPGTVTEIYSYAVKAIANTDTGTIIAKNNAGTTMTAGTITYGISDARGTAYTVTPSANNTFVAGDILTFTTAKTTAGGLVQLSITVTRT